MNWKRAGFTLMELLVVIAIIGILVVIAIPSYRTYTRRAHYTEVVQAAAPYKMGVETCFQITGDLENCTDGANGVPPGSRANGGLVNTIEVGDSGMITVTPQAKFGIQPTDTYILTPTAQEGRLLWASSGGGVSAGYAD